MPADDDPSLALLREANAIVERAEDELVERRALALETSAMTQLAMECAALPVDEEWDEPRGHPAL